jgi:ferredoxin
VTLAAQRLTVQSGEGSLLQSLEAAGLDPAYGCRRGICMQCLCQKSQGLVRNLVTGETSDAGPGQIQLCISQPLSAVELSLV